jgi:hypothetical protein
MLTQPHLRADLMRETARRCARVTRRGCSPMVDGGALTASIRSQSDAQAAEPRQAPCANADGVVTTLATQALIPGSTGRHQMESVPQLSSQDGSGRVQLKDFGPTRNRKVGECLSPFDYVVAAMKQRGPFPSRLLPVCCPAAGSGTAPAWRERSARPVTRAVVGWR